MKSYIELNDEEKRQIEEYINEVRILIPDSEYLFSSEKLDSLNNIVLKTKQDYDQDKTLLLRSIEGKRKQGIIDKEKSKKLKNAVIVLFNEFIRISPKKTIEIKQEQQEDIMAEETKKVNLKQINQMQMQVAELYAFIHGTYVKIPEKILYKLIDIDGEPDKQHLQYFITNDEEIQYIKQDDEIMKK